VTVTIKVNGTDNSVSHKGAMHFAKNTAPDVCKTPSPSGPVPIPYPVIMSMSSDLANGSTTVKADGGNMIATKGSEYSRCNGDEPGTVGGIVSSTNMKEASWILYSFDVKIDGANACRKTDKMKMNHGNTFCMSGNDGKSVAVQVAEIKIELCKMLCNSNAKSSNELEHDCEDSTKPDFGKMDVKFFQSYTSPGNFKIKTTKPDAVLVNKKGEPLQCFDFKRCDDYVRDNPGVAQARRQRSITKKKRKLVVISHCTCNCPKKCPDNPC
jgi:hypothetical protein